MGRNNDKKPSASIRRAEPRRNLTPPKLMLLFTVVSREKAELYMTLIQGFEVNAQFSMAASGTADSEMLSLLGLSDSSKTVIISIIREDMTDSTLSYLSDKFKTIKNGNGIAFTVPMSGIIGVSVYRFLSNSGA